MTSCSVGIAAGRCTEGRGFEYHAGTNTFLPNITLLVSEVILIIYLKHQPETPQTC